MVHGDPEPPPVKPDGRLGDTRRRRITKTLLCRTCVRVLRLLRVHVLVFLPHRTDRIEVVNVYKMLDVFDLLGCNDFLQSTVRVLGARGS